MDHPFVFLICKSWAGFMGFLIVSIIAKCTYPIERLIRGRAFFHGSSFNFNRNGV